MRPTMDPLLYFSTDRREDSDEVNAYRTRMAMAQLEISGVNNWTERGYTFDQRHVDMILVAGIGALEEARVAELCHMHDTKFTLVNKDTSAYWVDPRCGTRIPLGFFKLVKPEQLHDMLRTNAPFLRITSEDWFVGEFYVTGS